MKTLGGTVHEREPKRFEVTHVPTEIRHRDRVIGTGDAVLPRYERITFEKELINVPGRSLATFVCPGHPLLDATIDLILERYRDLLKRGVVLVDENNRGEDARTLSISNTRFKTRGRMVQAIDACVSKRMQFAEIDCNGRVTDAGYAPYLDYRPITDNERAAVASVLEANWLCGDLESSIIAYTAESIVPKHLDEVRTRKEELVHKTMAAVQDRLTKEITYWDNRAIELKNQELAGKSMARLNSGLARQRADDLEARLKQRMQELEQEQFLSPLPPVVIGGALVVPQALLDRMRGQAPMPHDVDQADRARIDRLAMDAVLAAERGFGTSRARCRTTILGMILNRAIRRASACCLSK